MKFEPGAKSTEIIKLGKQGFFLQAKTKCSFYRNNKVFNCSERKPIIMDSLLNFNIHT